MHHLVASSASVAVKHRTVNQSPQLKKTLYIINNAVYDKMKSPSSSVSQGVLPLVDPF
jgi:hypothetical protein